MTQEEKSILLKELCARLPYGVKGIITYDKSNTTFTVEGIDNNILHLSDAEECYVEDFKPYLRPMPSMTEEEKDTYDTLTMCNAPWVVVDWLNKKMFDYRKDDEGKTMIEKGLALEAPEGMYNIKEK